MKLIAIATITILGIGSVGWELTHKKDTRYVALMILYFIVLAVIVGAMT